MANPDQLDTETDGDDKRGDACDNCPFLPNLDQEDADGDGKGNLILRDSGCNDIGYLKIQLHLFIKQKLFLRL